MGPNPTDRGKLGTKRSLLTDGRGLPLGLAVAGANVIDFKLLEQTLDAAVVPRPNPTPAQPQHLCLDKGYDYYGPGNSPTITASSPTSVAVAKIGPPHPRSPESHGAGWSSAHTPG